MSNQEQLINIPTKIKYFKKHHPHLFFSKYLLYYLYSERNMDKVTILNLPVDPKLTDICKWIFITIIAIDVPAHILRNGAIQIISI